MHVALPLLNAWRNVYYKYTLLCCYLFEYCISYPPHAISHTIALMTIHYMFTIIPSRLYESTVVSHQAPSRLCSIAESNSQPNSQPTSQSGTYMYTGWPRKNATLSITNLKEIRDLIKLVSALMHRKLFSQQNDTKSNNFDEGILILEPFFWGNVIFKICFFSIKSHDWGREEFLWVASPGL